MQGIERFGGIDVVMANAGIATHGSLLAVDPKAFKTLIDVNVVGVFNTVRAALPSVIERRGYVLIVSSAAAYAPGGGHGALRHVEGGRGALRQRTSSGGRPPRRRRRIRAHAAGSTRRWSGRPRPNRRPSRKCCASCRGRWARPRRSRSAVRRSSRASRAANARSTARASSGLLRWLKPLLSSRLGESTTLKHVPELLPKMDAEVAAHGRSMSARTEALEKK